MAPAPVSRRERHRVETREEAKRLALGQLAESGPCALSLTGIARQMGITGPALYRYFAGRDELLAELVTDACEDLADAVHAAAQPASTWPPRARVRAVAAAYRDWALSQPHRYRLLFGVGTPPGVRTGAARRTVAALQDALTRPVGAQATKEPHTSLERLGLTAWTRWHGVLSLQIDGHLGMLGADARRTFQAEVDSLVDAAEHLAARTKVDRSGPVE